MNLYIPLMKLSVSKNSANSICTAWTDIQTKLQPYFFTLDLFCLRYVGPKKSTLDQKNGGLLCFILNRDKVLIKGSFGLAFLCLHTINAAALHDVCQEALIDALLNYGCLLLIKFLQFSLYSFHLEMVLSRGACFSLIMVGSVLVLEDLFKVLHVKSIWKVMFWLLQFLELSKSFSSYQCFLNSNKIISSNIWFWWFFGSLKTLYTPNKAACWNLLLPIQICQVTHI